MLPRQERERLMDLLSVKAGPSLVLIPTVVIIKLAAAFWRILYNTDITAMQSHNLLRTKIPKTEDPRTWDVHTGQSVLKGETPYGTKRLWVKQPTGKTSYRTKHQTGQKFDYKTSYGDKM